MRKDIISRIAVIGVALGIALAGTGCGESSSVSGKDETGQEQTGQDETGQGIRFRKTRMNDVREI